MREWNNDWRNELEEKNYDCYIRLCECRNTKRDLLTMACLIAKYNPIKNVGDCVDYILEWVGDWNGQYDVTDLTMDEYKIMVETIKSFRGR